MAKKKTDHFKKRRTKIPNAKKKFFNDSEETKRAREKGYRSAFEAKIAADLLERGIEIRYEERKIFYFIPEEKHIYTPDFILPSGVVLEIKGRWTLEDRKKIVLVKASNPSLDLRIVFQNPFNKITKGSKTTYADWCDKNGIIWASGCIPEEWYFNNN